MHFSILEFAFGIDFPAFPEEQICYPTWKHPWYYKVDKRTGHHRIVGGWGNKIKTREGKPDMKQRH